MNRTLIKPGMNWSNRSEWHIDHIKPLVSFDLDNRDQFIEAVNYRNLQPLWKEENIRKNGFLSIA